MPKHDWAIQDDYVECRLRNHHWERKREKQWLVVENGWLVWKYECSDCGTEKKQPYNYRTGEIRHPIYSHPKGYLLELNGKQRPSRAELRLECLHSIIGNRDVTFRKKSAA